MTGDARHLLWPSLNIDVWQWRLDSGTGGDGKGCILCRRPQGEPVGSDAVPFLDQHPVGLEESANLGALPAHRLFQDRSEYSQGIGAEDRSPRDLGNVL